jgi:hypothetical protein
MSWGVGLAIAVGCGLLLVVALVMKKKEQG